jgi:hypothetical protein
LIGYFEPWQQTFPPQIIQGLLFPFMLDPKLNTGAGVQRIKVPDQALFGQEYLGHTGRSFQDEPRVSSFVSSNLPST